MPTKPIFSIFLLSSAGRACGCKVTVSSLTGKLVSENLANSAKPKSKDMATPSKGHECVLCVETLHGGPKAETQWSRQSPDYDVESDVVK